MIRSTPLDRNEGSDGRQKEELQNCPSFQVLETHTVLNKGFSYGGIFGPGGFLSSISHSIPAEDPILDETCGFKSLAAEDGSGIGIDMTSNSNSVPVFKKLDLPPEQLIFSIDHILEKISSSLETPDLLNCRLTCTRWNYFAAAQIQKRLSIEFRDYNYNYNHTHNSMHTTTTKANTEKSLKHLNKLLVESNMFPCKKFKFLYTERNSGKTVNIIGHLSDPGFLDFLSLVGSGIDELTFKWCYNAMYAQERDMMDRINNLLVHRAPNIKFFSIDVPFRVEWKIGEGSRDDYSPLQEEDPEFFEIHDQIHTKENSKGVFSKLKVVQLGMWTSPKLLEQIILLSPNLQEVILEDCYSHFLVEPLNRLYLLKSITVGCSVVVLERLEKICRASLEKDGLKLNTLILDLRYCNGEWNRDLETRVVYVINRMLECSWDSLQCLRWKGVTILRGIVWPKIMPRLTTLELRNRKNLFGQEIFPSGFSLAGMCPSLKWIRLQFKYEYENLTHLLKSLKFGPVWSVREVMIVHSSVDFEVDEPILQEHLTFILHLFPNAGVRRELYNESFN